MSELQVFNFEDNQVRTQQQGDDVWFCLKDVCEILEISNSRRVAERLNEKGVTTSDTLTNGGIQKLTFINESNLYKVVFQSRKPQAEQFTEWVTNEVLPTIRKKGAYLTDEKAYSLLNNPNSLADLLQQASEQLRNKDIVIQEMKPKALFADAVATSKTSILIGELAKILKQNGFDVGQNRLFEILRQDGYLIKQGASRNMPSQKSMEQGLMEIKESTFNNPDGSVRVTKTTKITGKGQIHFVNKYCKK